MIKRFLAIILSISTSWIATAVYAAGGHAAATARGGLMSMLPMLLIFIVIFYFLLIRPQSKRAKEQKNLLEKIAVGDEVLTAGGFVGRVLKLKDTFLVLDVGKSVEIMIRKSSIASILPKGTMNA
jgi:preprotein translocase subunit YajC